jgi:hypothetical protein
VFDCSSVKQGWDFKLNFTGEEMEEKGGKGIGKGEGGGGWNRRKFDDRNIVAFFGVWFIGEH